MRKNEMAPHMHTLPIARGPKPSSKPLAPLKKKKQFVVRIEAYEGEKSSIALVADSNDTLKEMYCVGMLSDDGIADLIDNGYPSLGELYEAWPELKSNGP
jgi:hypothetical protein